MVKVYPTEGLCNTGYPFVFLTGNPHGKGMKTMQEMHSMQEINHLQKYTGVQGVRHTVPCFGVFRDTVYVKSDEKVTRDNSVAYGNNTILGVCRASYVTRHVSRSQNGFYHHQTTTAK